MQAEIAAVEDLYRRLIGAWNDRNAKAMAGLYTSRGAQVGFDGSAMETPASIESHLAPIFRDHPTARFIVKVRDTRLIGTDAAILRAVAGMVKPDALDIIPDRNAIQTMVASRGDTGWRVEMFQNTPARFDGRPDEAAKLTAELQEMARPQG